ncbi:MAG: MFS transporter [Maribacter sp.]|uniref:spinster family MFS transporter n=1 Tax=Maribacter sp. TaxID=1897614 RepID=UPI003298FF08
MTDPTTNSAIKYRGYTLFILTAVYVFNFIDRQILVILQESIKQELNLSDTQLGLMSGFTFAIFYVSFGLPIARLADKGNRRNIIAISLTVWSAFTAISGSAQNFIQLLLARIGVGIGEAGGSPPAHSIISDLYPAKKRATALAIYSTGISIGILLGFLLGGWIDQYFGWRTAFLVVGIPGILFALILLFTVKEPPRGLSEKGKDAVDQPHSMKDVFKLLREKKSFRYIAVGAGLAAYVSYTVNSWLPPFMARVHGMSSGEIGTWLSLIFGIGTGIGYFMGGYLTDRIAKKDMRWYLWLPASALLLAIPLALVAFFANGAHTTLFAIILPAFLNSLYLAPCIALTHGIVNVRMRALASAILFFVLNIIGLGLGPFVGGIISDALQPSLGVDALRWALSNSVIASVLSALCFYLASKSIRKDLIV